MAFQPVEAFEIECDEPGCYDCTNPAYIAEEAALQARKEGWQQVNESEWRCTLHIVDTEVES